MFFSILQRIIICPYIFALVIGFACLIGKVDICLANNIGEIVSVESKDLENECELLIIGTNIDVSTIYELPSPDRVIADIADAVLINNFKNQFNSSLMKLKISELKESTPNIVRFEFFLNNKMKYESIKNEKGIRIVFKKDKTVISTNSESQSSAAVEQHLEERPINKDENTQNKSRSTDKIGSLIDGSKSIEKQLPDVNPLDLKSQPKSTAKQMEDAFNFSAYNKERISVEFQKMDLHNVFNFLRQVSGVNIVVDESVQGSLTLVLDEVPWDFALDIILNLKDLEKEERFNTIVIYPKKKEFKWPDQSKNNLSFKADSKIVEKEALLIKQYERQPVESTEAKQLIAVARESEKNENFEKAVQFYEKALEKWPTNSRLAAKISSLYLGQLRQNAKSLFYAKIALEKDSKNDVAILNAAIASANMRDTQKAKYYFNQAVHPTKPQKEALLSFAAFNEENRDYVGAMQLLERHDTLYGEDIDSLVAAARLNDKMGKQDNAVQIYQKILSTGYTIPADLAHYIQNRIATK